MSREIRKSLIAFKGEAGNALGREARAVQIAERSLATTVQSEEFGEDEAIEFANQNRELLGADPLSSLSSSDLKAGISAPSQAQADRTINITIIERDFENLKQLFSVERKDAVEDSDTQLRSLLSSIRSDPVTAAAIQKRKLLEMGLSMLPETGECPLCETPWRPGELKSHLESHPGKSRCCQETAGGHC